jgi:hypothetical protein
MERSSRSDALANFSLKNSASDWEADSSSDTRPQILGDATAEALCSHQRFHRCRFSIDLVRSQMSTLAALAKPSTLGHLPE